MRKSSLSPFAARQLERDSQWYEHLADILFGVKTGVVKAKLDVRKGSKSQSIGKDQDLDSSSKSEQGIKEDEDLENLPVPKKKLDGLDCCHTVEDPARLDYYDRQDRARHAEHFTCHYQFAYGKKICIPPSGMPPIVCSSDYCFESTWVGVHGMQSICMVTCRDMGMTRLHPFYQRDCMIQQNMRSFTKATICEVECLPHKDVDYYDDAFRRSCTGSARKPFAVVSMCQRALEEFGYPNEVNKPLRKAFDYLESVVSSDLLQTHYGIIRVAITAYQLMCHRELRADDIWVTIMNVEPNQFDHLPVDVIGEQLDIVNGLSSEKDPQKPLFEYRGVV